MSDWTYESATLMTIQLINIELYGNYCNFVNELILLSSNNYFGFYQ